jgi:predicted secreted protein
MAGITPHPLAKGLGMRHLAIMTWFTGIVVYLLVWWTALFCVLPIGTRPDPAGDPAAGGWRGTPVAARLGAKLIGTTVLASLIWLGIWALVESEWLSFRSGILAMPGS